MKKRTFSMDFGWKAILNSLKVAPENVLRNAGLPDNFFNGPDLLLTMEEYFRFWSSLEQEVNNPLFPLNMVSRSTPENFNPIMLTALCCANLMQAAQTIAKYKHLMAPARIDIDVASDGSMTFTPRWNAGGMKVPSSIAYTEMVFFVHLARLGTRKNICPLRVVLPKFPYPQTLKQYEIFFGIFPEVEDTYCITFKAEDVLMPFITSNEAMCKAFEPELQRRLLEADSNTAMHERVKSLLIELLPTGKATIEEVANRLATSSRSLQRSLNAEGFTFRKLLNQLRETLAEDYLLNTSKSGAEIALMLGFENPNSFYRAFQIWTGKNPDSIRSM